MEVNMTKWSLSKVALRASYLFTHVLFLNISKLESEDGEGVISTAIVVLIVAFLAVGMWIAFKALMGQTTTTISSQVSQLGQ